MKRKPIYSLAEFARMQSMDEKTMQYRMRDGLAVKRIFPRIVADKFSTSGKVERYDLDDLIRWHKLWEPHTGTTRKKV